MSDVTCSIPGCTRKHNAHGLCGLHYSRKKAHGDPMWEPAVPRGSGPTICTVEACQGPVVARGLCGKHYHQDQRGKFRGTCSIPDCSSPIRHREWCNKHYQRWNLHGDPLADNRRHHVDTLCSVAVCSKLAIAKGLCGGHYARLQAGKPLDDKPLRDYFATDDLAERLAHYAPPAGPDECWEWTGSTNKGYGVFSVENSRVRIAHVVAWEITQGHPLPAGMVVRHTCDNPPCVNPAHFLLGTHGDNNRDKSTRNRHGYNGKGFKHLTVNEVRQVRALHEHGVNMTEIARRFGRSRATIIRVVKRQVFPNVE